MKIMFLDDMKSRRDVFQRSSTGHTVDFAVNANQAIDLLKANLYDMIYLDHDLEAEHYDHNKDTDKDGSFVARALKEMIQHHGKIVIVHSLNPAGRANIKSILGDDFDIWMTENIGHPTLWQIDVNTLYGAIKKYNAQ
jgi:CheY-like chemotaxis protein